ncbi:MAG: Cysteine desulfurase [Candidatus Woesebacteria bacterium GW2011_GWA1_39_8]|uniref:Cysteine desulfurase n=1 Tax=Candidatus Woesebacteria bacterium GW2011_GWA1_39_8 TaxID=1618552 RepID=A0A0G0S4W7_9BACT|nr:MAG: Cysteine desulfurase [Candidatus Woesebacteria bacterium GW2011_GWA1_39_8]
MAVRNRKKDFPIFVTYPKLVYLDSASTSQKPRAVIDAVTDFYTKYNSNVDRGIYDLSEKATAVFENSRAKVAKFIGAPHPEEIIFTANASEALNLVAYGYAKKFLKKGDTVVTTEMEHHSNFVPWLRLKDEIDINLVFLPINNNYDLDYEKTLTFEISKNKIKIVCLTHASNVLGTVNPVAKIVKFLKKNDIAAKVLVDGAQAVPHLPVDVQKLGCDFYVFSSHKMLGPSGVGVLWAKKELLKHMDPLMVGSHMIATVSKKKATWAEIPAIFETGTGRLEAVAGLGAAIDYLTKLGMKNIETYEKTLTNYALQKLTKIAGVKIFGKTTPKDRLGVLSFAIGNVHPHDVGEILNRHHIAIRAGQHCAQPLMQVLGVNGTARASLYIYNTKADIDKLAEGIMEVKRIFNIN